MAEYKLTNNGVVRESAGNRPVQHIQDDSGGPPERARNRHWVAYEAWLADGNTPDPEDPAPTPLTNAELLTNAEGDVIFKALLDALDDTPAPPPGTLRAAIISKMP